MTRIRYHEAAEDELITALGYLELQAKGLGRRFLDEVCRAERLIIQFPETAEQILPGIRRQVLRKFRYSLIYGMESGTVLILAVAHNSRRPAYWAPRIPSAEGEPEGGAGGEQQ